MGEYIYHNGHYYRAPPEHIQRRGHQRGGIWRTTYELWDGVLYRIGDVYYKIRGR